MKYFILLGATLSLFAACKTTQSSRTTPSYPGAPAPTAATPKTGNAQTDYIQRYKEIAVTEMQRSGIPASITLAQGILESASGQSELAQQANNHFGIKCGNGWSGKSHHKKDDERGSDGRLVESCFRKYSNPEESFFDHSEFLRDPRKSNRYGFLFNLDKRDYRSWARGLQSAGYATSQTYATQLIDLIERLRLYEYDQPGVVDIRPGEVIPATVPPQSRIYRVNDVKVVNAREGESIADIARIYNLKAENLADYNDRAYLPGESLTSGTRIYIQRKQKSWRGQATHHFVRENQNMLEIAQLYGIKLDNLLDCNGLTYGQEPAANEKVRLRGKRQSGETIKLRSAQDDKSDPTPADAAASPSSMTPDNNVLFEMSPNDVKPSQTGQPTTGGTVPGKPSTTGVPYPPDPVPVTPGTSPAPGTSNPQPAPTYPTTAPQPGSGPYHLVVKGDTLYSISRKYGTSVARIKELNNLPNDTIKIGQTLRVQ